MMHLLHRINRLKHLYKHKAPMTIYGREYVVSVCACGKAKIKGPLEPVRL